jgi:hypothetical protein
MGPAAAMDYHRRVLTTPTVCSMLTDLEKAQSARKNVALTAEKARSLDQQVMHQ